MKPVQQYAMIKTLYRQIENEEDSVMENEVVSKNFIEIEIDRDLSEGVYDTVHTRTCQIHPAELRAGKEIQRKIQYAF